MDTATPSQTLLTQLKDLPIPELERLVRHHNALYWDANAPEIDDPTFDKLVEALRKQAPASPVLDELGATLDRRFASVEHSERMLSLDKCYDDATLIKWKDKIPGPATVTPKIDGVACAIRYDETGALVLAATRGDGKVGDNITENVRYHQGIPNQLRIAPPAPVEVRGEVYMRISRFRAHYAADFANPRNLTAGALKHKEPEKTGTYELSFFAYDLLGAEVETEQQKHDLLEAMGFSLPPLEVHERGEELCEAFRRIEQKRGEYDYELDGVVMKACDIATQRRMGATSHHPRYAMAYKFQAEAAQTTLDRVEWSVGRSGVITPVAHVEPVFVSGVTVKRASLHNLGLVRKLGLTEKAQVEIVRRGEVIPHVERVLAPGGAPIEAPTQCPSCHGPVRIDGDFVYCEQPDTCPVVVRTRVKHFLKVIDVNGFGDKHLTQLAKKGLVKKPADLFRLTKDQLMTMERLGEVSATKLIRELSAKRRLPLPIFLTALGLEEVGLTVAETLTGRFDTLAKLRAAKEEELAEIHGIGPSIAASVVSGLEAQAAAIDELASLIDVVAEAPAKDADQGHALYGKTVVFTGKLAQLDRKSAQGLVKKAGGKTPSSVSKELDYLVIGDDGSPLLGDGKKSTKHKTAEKLIEGGADISIITETAFLAMVEG